MSFAQRVRAELNGDISHARHCKIAEIAGMICFGARLEADAGDEYIALYTDSEETARKYFTYTAKTFNIELLVKIDESSGKKERHHTIRTAAPEDCSILLSSLKATVEDGIIYPGEVVTLKQCCKRAFLRGAFLASGSVSDPKKGYHLEFAVSTDRQADLLIETAAEFDLLLKKTFRKGLPVVYAKDSQVIADILGVTEAMLSVMELENIRIEKDVINDVNRAMNCDIANARKARDVAAKQIRDIEYIQEKMGFDELPKGLREIAKLRLENPDSPLSELAEKLEPPLGKSGANHRLQKLSQIADDLRGTKEEERC